MITMNSLLNEICQKSEPPSSDLIAWLNKQPDKFEWLIAHTYNEIVWGRRVAAQWHLSSDLSPNNPLLTGNDLLEMRLFGLTGEQFIWRTSQGLQARTLLDEGKHLEVYDEEQIVWGTHGQRINEHFTKLIDGQQGLVSIVPLPLEQWHYNKEETFRPVRLHVRHYITAHKETGLARITLSRLMHVTAKGEDKTW